MIIDANTVKNLDDNSPDVIIVGAGSAGLVCAKEILTNKPDTKLTIFESGGLNNIENANHLDTDYSIDDRIDFRYSKARYLGGKSDLWRSNYGARWIWFKKWPINLKELNFWKKSFINFRYKKFWIEWWFRNKKKFLMTLLDFYSIIPLIPNLHFGQKKLKGLI